MDRSGPTPIRVFESGAILMYLAEKFGAYLPTEASTRAECLSWLFWQMGSAPYLGGGFGHFYAYAPTKIEYAIDRFAMEVKRQLDVLDRRLAENEYLAGGDYTIADMAVWPWYGGLAKGWLYEAAEFLQVQEYQNVQRWADTIWKRPAVQRGRMVNRVTGELSSQLHERHDPGDFETQTQDKLTAGGGERQCQTRQPPPARGRGSKRLASALVADHVKSRRPRGAWIETTQRRRGCRGHGLSPARGRGSKLSGVRLVGAQVGRSRAQHNSLQPVIRLASDLLLAVKWPGSAVLVSLTSRWRPGAGFAGTGCLSIRPMPGRGRCGRGLHNCA
jgi:glutathione S-transferase